MVTRLTGIWVTGPLVGRRVRSHEELRRGSMRLKRDFQRLRLLDDMVIGYIFWKWEWLADLRPIQEELGA
jgi:hypothetical protein